MSMRTVVAELGFINWNVGKDVFIFIDDSSFFGKYYGCATVSKRD